MIEIFKKKDNCLRILPPKQPLLSKKYPDEKTSFIPKYCVFMYRYTRTYYSSNALTIPRLLPLSPWYNPIQSRFYHNLYHIPTIFHLFDNSRNQP